MILLFFFFNDTATTEIYTLSLHDALPISRVMPGMRAHGHMGVDRVTVRNLKVLKIDSENHLILVKGAVPGANGGYVVIRKAVAAKPEPQPQLQEKPKKGKK